MEVYLDYSATTKVDKEVLDYFNYVCNNFYANPNSNHDIGKKCNDIISLVFLIFVIILIFLMMRLFLLVVLVRVIILF